MDKYYLSSPFLTLTFEGRPRYFRAILVGWAVLWAAVTLALLYGYAVVFKDLVGFETAVLVGIGFVALSLNVGGSDE